MPNLVVSPTERGHLLEGDSHEIFDAELLVGMVAYERRHLHIHEICHSALFGPIGDSTHSFLLPIQGIPPAGSMKGLKAICLRSFLRFSSARA
jgi:hypothetical protein